MRNTILKKIALAMIIAFGAAGILFAQEPIGGMLGPGPVFSTGPGQGPALNSGNQPGPPPGGLGNGPAPAPGSGVYNPGPQTAPPPPMAGNGPLAPMVLNTPLSNPNWQNQGTMTVIACGYDAQSVWRTIPLRISYVNTGGQYNVTVDSAWDPWTDAWNYGVDIPAFSTYYFLNGNYYNYYANLSTGTYYFNL